MNRPTWDEYFLELARVVASRADCRRAQHGCVIVDAQNRVVSTGYNGPPAGDPRSCMSGECPRGLKSFEEVAASTGAYEDCIALHAEQNAIAYGDGTRMRGGTLYVTGLPCPMCAKLIAASGVTRVVHP